MIVIADDAALAKINDVFLRAQSLVDEKVAITEQLAGDLASFVHRLDGDREKLVALLEASGVDVAGIGPGHDAGAAAGAGPAERSGR